MGKKKLKKKEVKSLVRLAAHDLGVEYQKGASFGDLIRSEAERLVRQGAASAGFDPDMNDSQPWRGLMRSRRDLLPIDQDKLIDVANYLRRQNPLASRICNLKRDFVIGDGVKFEAEDQKIIQPLLDEFWQDPINNMDEFQFDLVDALNVNGELLLPVFINEFSGAVQLGWIDPVEVETVVPDRLNRRIMREVVMKFGAGAGFSNFYDLSVKKTYHIANVDTNPLNNKTYGFRVGDILFFRMNCAPDAMRGRSDLESWADLVDAWDQANFNDLERVQLLLNFIWDVKLTGKTEPEIQKWLAGQQSPKPGSLRAHNENVEWKAEAPDLKMTETRKLSDGVRTDVLGTAGFAPFFIGITETSNKSSSDNLDLPILKGLQSYQRKVRSVFKEMGDFAIDQVAIRRPVIRRMITDGKISRAFKMVMPELSVKDMTKIGGVLAQTTAALDEATRQGWLTKQTAAKMFASIANQFGVEYDPVAELKLAAVEQKKAQGDAALEDYNSPAGQEAKRKLTAVA